MAEAQKPPKQRQIVEFLVRFQKWFHALCFLSGLFRHPFFQWSLWSPPYRIFNQKHIKTWSENKFGWTHGFTDSCICLLYFLCGDSGTRTSPQWVSDVVLFTPGINILLRWSDHKRLSVRHFTSDRNLRLCLCTCDGNQLPCATWK